MNIGTDERILPKMSIFIVPKNQEERAYKWQYGIT